MRAEDMLPSYANDPVILTGTTLDYDHGVENIFLKTFIYLFIYL